MARPHPGLLYLVSAEEDEVIMVDVESMELIRRESWTTETLLERLLAWWVPAARAEVGEMARRQLAISPDGASLFVASLTPGFERIERLDTETLEVVASSDFRPMEVPYLQMGRSFSPSTVTTQRLMNGQALAVN